MNIINQATNYVNASWKYENIFTMNITCMMVLSGIYLSVSTSLPTTATIKPVEVWLLFNLAYPFLVIMVNIVLQRLEAASEEEKIPQKTLISQPIKIFPIE